MFHVKHRKEIQMEEFKNKLIFMYYKWIKGACRHFCFCCRFKIHKWVCEKETVSRANKKREL